MILCPMHLSGCQTRPHHWSLHLSLQHHATLDKPQPHLCTHFAAVRVAPACPKPLLFMSLCTPRSSWAINPLGWQVLQSKGHWGTTGATRAAAELCPALGCGQCQTWMCQTWHDGDKSLNRTCHLVALGQCCWPASHEDLHGDLWVALHHGTACSPLQHSPALPLSPQDTHPAVGLTIRSQLLFWGQSRSGFELAGKLQATAKILLQPRLSLKTSNCVNSLEMEAQREESLLAGKAPGKFPSLDSGKPELHRRAGCWGKCTA